MARIGIFIVTQAILATAALAADSNEDLKVSLSWGHQCERSIPYYIRLLAEDAEIQDLTPYSEYGHRKSEKCRHWRQS